MRILITNDDGINAEGIKHLVNWAKTKGEVTVFAPKFEQSGKSRSIEIHKGYECKKVDLFEGVTAYSVDSTPADCVRVAILGFHLEFDLVLSGINRGFNVGEDVDYSGTVAACFEGAHLGTKALAVSTHWNGWEDAIANLDKVYDYICEKKMFDHAKLINVNIPENPKGICVTRVGEAIYSDDFDFVDDLVVPVLITTYKGTKDLSVDTDATMNGYISISPVTLELTDLEAFEKLKK